MKFTKPSWVIHHDVGEKETKKRLSIFSIHVHPDGSRIATGGLDAKIRIWSTKPILNEEAHASGFPTNLSTLTMHTGPVLSVRWAYSGKWLASGSDDAVVMIWDLDPAGSGRVWGTDEVNIEGWKALKRLPGHESDVTDLAWSSDDRYLASVGLDSMVIVWCGLSLQQLIRLESHQGFVKGVCWDPVGEYLATQSDDKTVKIWRTTDWGLEATIDKPFRESPGSTFFRRLSWSPDGAHITASNAMNNKGAVFVAAVIARQTWTSEISLVGHENTVEVAAYNPHIFLRNPEVLKTGGPVATSNICSVVALGADDRTVSVWETKSARPLIVARNVFERQILDLSWSFDGLTLYACSSDGSIAVFDFYPDEIEGIAPTSVQQQYLQKFGFVPPPLPARYQPPPPPPPRHQEEPHAMAVHSQDDGFGAGATMNGNGEVNQLVARRGKKRIKPTFVASLTSPSSQVGSYSHVSYPQPVPPQSTMAGPGHAGSVHLSQGYEQAYDIGGNGIRLPAPPLQNLTAPNAASASIPSGHYVHPHHQQQQAQQVPHEHWLPPYPHVGSPFYVPPPASQTGYVSGAPSAEDGMSGGLPTIDAYGPDGKGKGKRKAGDMDLDMPKGRARTLGGDRVREVGPVRELPLNEGDGGPSLTAGSGTPNFGSMGSRGDVLSVPSVKTYLSVRVETSEDILEGSNFDDGRPTEVLFVSGKQTQWLDYLPSPVIGLAATSVFCAVAMADGSLNVYSHTGRKMMLTVTLTAPISFLEASKAHLMAITASGDMTVWNVKTEKATFAPTSVLPLFVQPKTTIVNVGVRANGAPIINLSSGIAHSYDANLLAWVRISEAWWADGSDAWTGRQRNSNNTASRGIIAILEAGISELNDSDENDHVAEKPQWWNAAKTLGHLEERQSAARLLDSPGEFKHSLLLYAKRIAEEGFRGKAEELVRELFGPVYWRPNKEEKWDPMIVGLLKRDLLKDVLSVFARSKTLAKLGMDWQDVLRRSAVEELP
ncbi:WD40-repeat-containing domain protein [Gautieria morchelliformis]|nr:WD40-repeat-containing domain protein [Gautieria morchelliformis]